MANVFGEDPRERGKENAFPFMSLEMKSRYVVGGHPVNSRP